MSNFALLRSNVAGLLLFLLALETGCRVWVEKPLRPDTNVRVGRHRQVRIITNAGDTLVMRAVAFTKDSVLGLDARLERYLALPRDSVKAVEVRMDGTPEWVRIAWKVYLGVVFALGLALYVTGIAFGIAARKAR